MKEVIGGQDLDRGATCSLSPIPAASPGDQLSTRKLTLQLYRLGELQSICSWTGLGDLIHVIKIRRCPKLKSIEMLDDASPPPSLKEIVLMEEVDGNREKTMDHVFKSHGACAAFLANYNPRSFAEVSFGNMHYNLPPWSISILPDCKNTVSNTARMGAQTARMKMTPVPVRGGFSWQAYNEETTAFEDSSFMMVGLLEKINATRDVSNYLWYMTE
ncbi:hypothetical protein CDL15_Pgr005528 [Punica granatum]|uniref:Beta-galactosidase beta-sandwich domain-containing protein n=1 Tax=Punica granatum TaxID=22663 RepID=A0A218WUQ3_PUNGR|nr:hypothetical protein CDL15_Pgr005528 [Punica granatum]